MTFSREARVNGVASPLFSVFVCTDLDRGACAGARKRQGPCPSVRPSGKAGRFRPQARPPKGDSGTFRNQSRAHTRGVFRLPRGSNFIEVGVKLLPRRDGELTKRTLELDPGPGFRWFCPPVAFLGSVTVYYDLLLVLPEARGIRKPGLLHPPNVTRVSLTCFPVPPVVHGTLSSMRP